MVVTNYRNDIKLDLDKLYDFYEVEFREIYKISAKPQNDSHFVMLKTKAKEYLKKDRTFCEVGFGAGITLRKALKYFGKVYGLDISPKNVELTTKELMDEGFKNFELYVSDLKIFDPRFEKKFDVVSFIHGLEHFTDNDYPIILRNVKRYLKEGGIFTGALPYKNHLNYRKCPDCGCIFEIDGHVSSHDLATIREVFLKNEFNIVHLDNFNLKYTLSKGDLIKKIMKFLLYEILKYKRTGQIEFIVKPSM